MKEEDSIEGHIPQTFPRVEMSRGITESIPEEIHVTLQQHRLNCTGPLTHGSLSINTLKNFLEMF